MKIPIGKLAAWIGRTLLTAMVTQAAERLSRPKPADDGRDQADHEKQADQHRLNPE